MRVIEVRAPGMLTTVQDLGRVGFGAMGVSTSGAADAVALRVGNRLVGNAVGAAGLEMTLLGGTFEFPQGGVVALTGSYFGAMLNDEAVELWTTLKVEAGQTLRVGATQSGARCYLCVSGGIKVKEFLGSASTHLLSGLGGFEGRALRKGDVLELGEDAGAPFRSGRVTTKALEQLAARKIFRVTAGPQSAWFSQEVQKAFYENVYRVEEDSNRMGLRLGGSAPLPGVTNSEMISEGVANGAVQITAAGLPIILFVEQQTTGGYAKIANVISADLHSVGQLRPRDEIRFDLVSMETALAVLREQEALLASEELVAG
jgi:antagonist of KipI